MKLADQFQIQSLVRGYTRCPPCLGAEQRGQASAIANSREAMSLALQIFQSLLEKAVHGLLH